MKTTELKPDLGLYMAANAPGTECFGFAPVRLSEIMRVEAGLYAATSGMEVEGQAYAMTFDFKKKQLEQLLTFLAPSDRRKVRAKLNKNRTKPAIAELPEMRWMVTTKLGELTEGAYEVFIPFVVFEVKALHDDKAGSPLFVNDEICNN